MALATLASFVDGIFQSEVLSAEQCDEVRRLRLDVANPRELAQLLLKREWLTAYQINQIFQGKGAALTLGPFVLLERIGEGGMGQVYKARQRLLNRVVALKVIRKECLNNPKVVLRFQREIRAAGQLSHPHIVRAFDADQVNGTYYIALEFIDGVDLARLVADNGPLRVDQACEYIRQAALGLQHAYERGLVHRDLKPANLLVTRGIASDRRRSSGLILRPAPYRASPPLAEGAESLAPQRQSGMLKRFEPALHYPFGVVKILDMGLARCTDAFPNQASTHLTQIGAVMGTPEFIAPEQARDPHNSDIRADLYSLGCTLYFLLTGQPPFPHGTITEKLLQHQFNEPVPVEVARRDGLAAWAKSKGRPAAAEPMMHVPAAVVRLLRRLLEKDPDRRVQTPLELASELQTIVQKLADGALQREEALERTAEMPALAAAAAPSSGHSIIHRTPPVPAGSFGARFALVSALLGGLVCIICATVLAVVIGAGNLTRAASKSDDESRVKAPPTPGP